MLWHGPCQSHFFQTYVGTIVNEEITGSEILVGVAVTQVWDRGICVQREELTPLYQLARPVLLAQVSTHVMHAGSIIEEVVHHIEHLVASLPLKENVQVEILVTNSHGNTEDKLGQR